MGREEGSPGARRSQPTPLSPGGVTSVIAANQNARSRRLIGSHGGEAGRGRQQRLVEGAPGYIGQSTACPWAQTEREVSERGCRV